MKRLTLSLVQLMLCASSFSLCASSYTGVTTGHSGTDPNQGMAISSTTASTTSSIQQWKDNKYSMFIHFGIYSSLGGVWQGKPVTYGYSEQIQSHAGIYSDVYGGVPNQFNPTNFNADEIVALAKKAGMRSIVFTSKHHDGFCMFNTKTTDYNSVEATPCQRDFVGELAKACHKADINFALYFSLIDWHFPYGYPISSHNCDFITPQHHELNMKQVRELLTNYGEVTELWFDMGSLQPNQSKDLYQLVKSLQPNCMISGRLGNDYYDFAVMGDNALPEEKLEAPWQSAASMFNETWSYRSWQQRGEVKDKVAEKLKTLIHVIAAGGNFLLNIGPDNLGGVVPFEKDVLTQMGAWIHKHAEAIYGCEPSPFNKPFDWGTITRKGNSLYLHLCGTYPKDGKILLPLKGMKCINSNLDATKLKANKDGWLISVDQADYDDLADVKVIRMDFDQITTPNTQVQKAQSLRLLTAKNAMKEHSYSCFDYNTNYKSTTAYQWKVNKRNPKDIEIFYSEQEIGSTVTVEVDNHTYHVALSDEKPCKKQKPISLQVVKEEFAEVPLWGFDSPVSWTEYIANESKNLKEIQSEEIKDKKAQLFSNFILRQTINASAEGQAAICVTAGNGVEVVLNGQSIAKHLNPYRSTSHKEVVLLNVKKGQNDLIIRGMNRFEKSITLQATPLEQTKVYKTTVTINDVPKSQTHTVRLSRKGLQSPHTDAQLHNIYLKIN